MKRIVAFLLALLMTLTMTTLSWAEGKLIIADGPGPESPASGTCGAASNVGGRDSVKWEVTPNGGRVAYEDEDGNTVLRPAYTLTISGEGEMMDNPGLESAKNWAVRDKNRLPYRDLITEVIVEEGVTSLGEGFCIYMQEDAVIKLPASLAKIGRNAFAEIEKPVELAEGNAVFKVVDNVLFTSDMKTLVRYFSDRKTVKSYEIPSSVETLADTSFEKARLEEVIIGKNVKNIGFRAFRSCLMLKTVTFAEGNSLEEFDNIQAFYNCPKLESIDLPDSCTSVTNDTFRDCPNLRTIVARGITAREGFRSNYGSYHGFYKATVSYGAALLHGNYNGEVNGIGAAEYDVNGTQAERLDWYTLEGVKGDKDSINGTSTTVYAVYKADCSFDANGGTGPVTAIKSYVAPGLDDGQSVGSSEAGKINKLSNTEANKIPTTEPTRDGYAFVGWNTEADGSGDSYNPGDYLKTTNQPLTKLYAQWGKRAEDGTIYTVSCDTSLVYTGEKQTPNVTVKMTKGSDTTTLTAGTYRVQADADCSAGLHKGTVYLVNSDTNADTGVTIDFNYEIKKASCVLTVDQDSVSVKGKGTVTLNVSGGTVVTMADGDLKGSFADGVYTATAPDSTKNYTVTFTDAGDANHEGGTKSVTVYVTARSSADLTLIETVKTVKAGAAASVTYTYNGDGAVTATSSDETVAKVTVDAAKKIISITPLKDGTADIVVTGAATTNYKATAAVLVLTVEKRDVSLTLNNSTWTVKAGVANSVRYTYDGDGAVTAASSDETVAKVTVDAEKKLIDITPLKAGKVDITVSAAATDTCKAASAKLELTVTTAAVIKSDTETKEIDAGAAKELIVNVPDINGKPAKVVFNQAAADYLRGRGEDLTLKLTVIPMPDSLKNSEQVKGKTCVMVEVTLTDANGGNVFTAPVQGAEATVEFYGATGMENVKAYFVNANGELEALAEQQYKYTSDGLIMLTLEHFSQYLVAGEEPVTPPTPTPTPSRPIRINQTKTTSPGTGDAGVAIYAVSAMLSMAGGVCLFRKKKND